MALTSARVIRVHIFGAAAVGAVKTAIYTYDSDLTDPQWKYLQPMLPEVKKRGRRPTDRRLIFNAILYVLKGGIPWRLLPANFPPWQTVYRRDWLNIFQVNPRVPMLANNASSDPVGFILFEYSDLALHTPPLAKGLTANDLIRMTLDRYLAGALGYGQVGYGPDASGADVIGWKTPWTSLDTLPSFLISACNYVEGSGDLKWAQANYDKLAAWGREMFAADKDGNGLIEYPAPGTSATAPKRIGVPQTGGTASTSATKTPSPTRSPTGAPRCSPSWRGS